MGTIQAQVIGSIAVSLTLGNCQAPTRPFNREGMHLTYQIRQASETIPIDADWDKESWRNVPAIELKNFMGERPKHFPKTQVRLLYSDEFVYAIFRVEDQYVRVVSTEYNQLTTWEDSCVEFFFTPNDELSVGFFNLETNAGGNILMAFRDYPDGETRFLEPSELDQIELTTTLPRVVEPEITEPTTWILEYRLPVAILERYCDVRRPAPGVTWRANFQKCGEKTSHPHYLTWSFIDWPYPKFALPDFFGTLLFE